MFCIQDSMFFIWDVQASNRPLGSGDDKYWLLNFRVRDATRLLTAEHHSSQSHEGEPDDDRSTYVSDYGTSLSGASSSNLPSF
jgi:hypothetical protein